MVEDENPYRSPQAALSDPVTEDGELASREGRLGAAILDTIIALVVTLPIMYFGGYFDQIETNSEAGQMFMPIGVLALWGAIGFALFVLIQAYPLHTTGQTWGKRVCKIKIVRMNGTQPNLGHLLLRRYLPINVISIVPVLGNVFGIVDVLMIFRADRRCAHDWIADTRVVRAH